MGEHRNLWGKAQHVFMHKRELGENSNERMADRPDRDPTRVDEESLPLDDTAPESSEPVPVDDV